MSTRNRSVLLQPHKASDTRIRDMAMLASKSPYPAPSMGGGVSQSATQYTSNMASYRNHTSNARADHTMFASPTESEFSEIYDAPDAIR